MLKNQKKAKLDLHTKKYIRNVKLMQLFVLLIVAISFAIFGHTMVSNNKENLKKVALAEVQESMEETIQNVIILIENLRWRVETQAMTDIMDLENRITKGGIKSIDDLLAYLEVCEENELGQAIKAIYTASDGQEYYILFFKDTDDTDGITTQKDIDLTFSFRKITKKNYNASIKHCSEKSVKTIQDSTDNSAIFVIPETTVNDNYYNIFIFMSKGENYYEYWIGDFDEIPDDETLLLYGIEKYEG